ncbi:MAG: hypothetical protein LBQ61_09395 [Spirochaetales bacterium]|jgi:hypothetical protein|nr:hypothetical protein [Spirochaetales bacterium]
MNRPVEYQDNLFWITEKIKLLEKAPALNLDPKLFSKQLIQDLQWVDQVLTAINKRLTQSKHTPQKAECLRLLMLAAGRAAEMGEALCRKKLVPQEAALPVVKNQQETAAALERLLRDDSTLTGSNEQVTREEFEFLLQQDTD